MPQPPPGHGKHRSASAMYNVPSVMDAAYDRPVEHQMKDEQAMNTVEPQPYQPGSLRLPFTMLKVVLDELADRLSIEEPISETESKTMAELAAELQDLATKTGGSKEAVELVIEAPVNDAPDKQPYPSEGAGGGAPLELDLALADIAPAANMDQWQQDLVSLFKELDMDNSGTLNTDELRRALIAAGVSQARLTKLIKLADADNSGEISMDEWIGAITHSNVSEMRDFTRRLTKTKETNHGTLFASKKNRLVFMIHPYSRGRMFWDISVTFACFYIALVLPFAVAFENTISASGQESFALIDRGIDALFIFDVILNFRTGFFSHDDAELIMDWKRAGMHYLCSWFLLDVLSSLPFSDISSGQVMDLQAFKLIKLAKLMKILKLVKPRNVDFSDASQWLEDISQSKICQMMYRRCGVFVNMLLLSHWMACGMKIVDDGFLKTYQDVKGELWSEYLAALYFSMTTLTTVGFGDITPSSNAERIFVTTSMVVGGGFYGYVVGSISSMVANNDLNASAYYERMDLINAWLTHHRLPMQIKRTLRRHFKAYLAEKSAVSEADIWHDLSPELQKDVGRYIISEDVKNNPLFDGMSIGSVVRLQSILQRVTILTGRTITSKGEAGTAMYIIVSGLVLLETDSCCEDDMPISPTSQETPASGTSQATKSKGRQLGPGQSFGEEVLLGFAETYEYTVTVLQKAQLEIMLEDEFLNLFNSMPNVLQRMRKNALDMNPEWQEFNRMVS